MVRHLQRLQSSVHTFYTVEYYGMGSFFFGPVPELDTAVSVSPSSFSCLL